MIFDWQSVAVALIVLAAVLYVGRRVASRLRSLLSGRRADVHTLPASGCGGCANARPASPSNAPPVKVLVQIGRSRPPLP